MGRSERTVMPLLVVAALITASAIAAAETAGPALAAVPETALVDEPVRITVTGCEPGQVVVLRAVTFDDDGMRWESRATFEADSEGRVDPGSLAPKSGTYDGVEPMGLFWSMRSDGGPRGGFAYGELDPLEVVLQLEIDGEVRESRRLRRQRVLPSVTRREIREEYFETAIELLGEQDGIDADRIGVWGASRGGELALLLGATFPQIRAVVAVVPSGVVWSGCCSREAFQRAAWTHDGEPITPLRSDEEDPDIEAHDAEVAEKMRAGEAVAHAPGFRLAVEKATHLEAATIPVERTRGPILLISGEADGLWPSTELAEIAMRRLRENEFSFRFEHWSYENAGHVFEHPFLPNPTISGRNFLYGGTPAGNAKAAADWSSRILAFYEEALRKQGGR